MDKMLHLETRLRYPTFGHKLHNIADELIATSDCPDEQSRQLRHSGQLPQLICINQTLLSPE